MIQDIKENTLTPKNKTLDQFAHPKYRADIDGLRAIAVLSVVVFHAFPSYMPGGFVGVDIFFVISGFLISGIIFENLERDTFSFIEFYSRRIKRIFPALFLVLIASLCLGWFALFADEYKQLGKHIAGGAGFIANFLFWKESGYFDNAAETKPLLHLWSLAIEEQFYIAWPFILWFVWKKKINVFISIITILCISFLLNISKVNSDAVAAFYMPQTRFWELLIGSVLAYSMVYVKVPEVNSNIPRNVRSLLGMILIIVGVFIITKQKEFPGWWAGLPTIGAALVISAGREAWFNRFILSNRVVVWIGLISYPLYLWHWPLLSFARIIDSGFASTRIVRVIAVILSIIFAWLTYRLIEKPIRFGEHSRIKTIVLFLLMIVVGYSGYLCYAHDGLEFRLSIANSQNKNFETIQHNLAGISIEYQENEICSKRYPFPEREKYKTFFCVQNKDEKPTILLIGSSFANHLYLGLTQNSNFTHHTILSIGNCEPAWASSDECFGHKEQQSLINGIVENSGSIQYAILSGLKEFSENEKVKSVTDAGYISLLKKKIDFLESHSIKVIIFMPHLRLSYDPRKCFSRPFSKSTELCELPAKEREDMLASFQPLMVAIKKTNPNVLFFDQNSLFCDSHICKFLKNNIPLVRDSHFSEYGSIEMSKVFANWALSNVPSLIRQ